MSCEHKDAVTKDTDPCAACSLKTIEEQREVIKGLKRFRSDFLASGHSEQCGVCPTPDGGLEFCCDVETCKDHRRMEKLRDALVLAKQALESACAEAVGRKAADWGLINRASLAIEELLDVGDRQYEVWRSADASEWSLFDRDNKGRAFLTKGLVHVATFHAENWEEAKQKYEKVMKEER